MTTTFSNPISRDDTLLGVCQSLGEDFGFNPNWLRVVLGAALIWNPLAVIGLYATLALLLAGARWAFPDPRRAAEAKAEREAEEAAERAAFEQDEPLQLAA